LIMDDQQQRSLDRRDAGHPAGHLICPDIPDELTFMQPELVDLPTVGAAPHSPLAPAGARHAACQTISDPPRPGS
jgi:hypothetical protein